LSGLAPGALFAFAQLPPGAAQATPATRTGKMQRMNLLAIETSTELGSIALWREGELLRRACPIGVAHSETLLPLIRATLGEAGLRFADLNAIAFAAGPGSFTGLRVACGVAQGLAFAHDLPVIPVGTLEAMALSGAGQRVIVALDARMGEVYYAFYVGGVALAAVAVCDPAALPLPESSGWLACGNGLKAYPALRERLSPCVYEWQPELMPDAGCVARLAAVRLAHGETVDAADAAPLYVRNKVAQTVAERLANGGKA
jgi:tRNA threonylcarbamoyladenosine biosynthesis protein TsaB